MIARALRALFLLAFATGSISGCTRNSATVKISLSIPQTTQKANKLNSNIAQSLVLSHVVINVTGNGLNQPIFLDWDGCHDCQVVPPPPTSFDVEMVPGQRLFQVLAIYKDTSTGQTAIKYGDQSKDVSGTNDSVTINLAQINAGASFKDGHMAGRFLTSSNDGPTGVLKVKYKPDGKPPMLLMSTAIVSGWFSAVLLKGVKFTYEVNGLPLFQDVDLDSPAFTPSLQVARVHFPAHYRQQSNNWLPEDENYQVFGFWGDPAHVTPKRICYENSQIGTNFTRRATTVSGTPLLQFQNVVGPYARIEGGESSVTGDCSNWMTFANLPNNIFTNLIAVDMKALEEGKDSSAGFMGMFGLADIPTLKIAKVQYLDQNTTRIETRLLPGVNAGLYDRVAVYKRVNATEFHFRGDSVPCDKLAEGKIPDFTLATEVNVASSTLAIDLPMPKVERSKTSIALCPKKGSENSLAGIHIDNWRMRAKYLRFIFNDSAEVNGKTLLTREHCHPATIQLLEGNDEFSNNDATPMPLSAIGAEVGGFFSMANCSSPTFTASIGTGQNQSGQIYFKAPTNLSSGTLAVTSPYPDIMLDNSQRFEVADAKIAIKGPSKVAVDLCNNFSIEVLSAAGQSIPAPISLSSIGVTGSPSLDYFGGNGNCSTATPIFIPAASYQSPAYVKGTSVNTHLLNATHVGFQTGTLAVEIVGGGKIINEIEITHEKTPLEVGRCSRVFVRLKNAFGAYIPSPSQEQFTITVPAEMGTLFSDMACSAPTNVAMFSPNQPEAILHFLPRKTDTSATGIPVNFQLINAPYPLTGAGTLAYVKPPANNSGAFYFEAPSFNGRQIIGSHEFPKVVPLRKPSWATAVECSTMPSPPASFSTANCTGVLDANGDYQWTAPDAVNDQVRYFQYVAGTIRSQPIRFQGSLIYGMDFKVVNCTTILGSDTFANVIAAPGTVCLNSASTISGTCTSINLDGSGKSIIGHSSGTSVLDASSCTSAPPIALTNAMSFGSAGDAKYIANLKVQNLNSSGVNGINIQDVTTAQSGNKIIVNGNELTSTAAGIGIHVKNHGNPNVTVVIARNKVTLNGAAANYGYVIDNFTSSPAMLLVTENSVASSNENAVGFANIISASMNGSFVSNHKYKFSGRGLVYKTQGSGAYTTMSELIYSDILIEGATSAASTGVHSGTLASLQIKNTRITGAAGNMSVGALINVDNSQTSLEHSILVQNEDFNFVRFAPNGGLLTAFQQNQFVYKGSVGPTFAALNGAGSTGGPVGASATSHGYNLFCSSSMNIWATLFDSSGGGGLHGSSTFNATNAQSDCTFTNSVSTNDTCKNPCTGGPPP